MSVEVAPSNSHAPLPPTLFSCLGPRRPLLPPPPPGFVLPKLPPLFHDNNKSLGSGLRTPPADNMSTTYQSVPVAYDSHSLHSYSTSLAHAGRARPTTTMTASQGSDSRNTAPYSRYPSQQSQLAHAPTAQSRSSTSSSSQAISHISDQSVKSTTPNTTSSLASSQDGAATKRPAETLIYHSLRIPKCISPNDGSLADFAAQMTCLFWFESIDELKKAESIRSRPSSAPISRLPPLAKPYDQFRKWVYNVLSTTQVTQNVILLALLFIYRLKMSTPQIKGRAGSEYRLLTVALMLGNKFLDDNTYTNKTWAEVSCFAVQEIHVMEVEFLSNMRYNLLASKEEWEDWLVKLACFHEYYDRASKLPASPIHVPSPSVNSFVSPVPSPTNAALPVPDLPPFNPFSTTSYSPSANRYRDWANAQNHPVSPLASKPAMSFPTSRKRSPETDPTEHPAKRQMPPRIGHVQSHPPLNIRPSVIADTARLPVPHLTIVTNQDAHHTTTSYPTTNAYATQVSAPPQTIVSLPPLQPGMRAMSTVYQSAPPPAVPQPAMTPTAVTNVAVTAYPTTTLPSHPTISYSTPIKHHHSPGSLAPYASSPMVEPLHFAPNSGVQTPVAPTPISHSPSVYLQQRASPYKPIRHVNRLLYPPPSASLDQYHLAVPVQPDRIHYQPLGRRNDLRTGVVPEFVVYNRNQYPPAHTSGGPQGPFAH